MSPCECRMERICVLLQLLLVWGAIAHTANSQGCPSGYYYITQPPDELRCNPASLSLLTLQCITKSQADIVTWYWTRNASNAGITGTAILPLDQSDSYSVTDFGSTNNKQIHFTVTQSTLGYYWCEISNANVSLRSSTITPVCLPADSLSDCTKVLVTERHNRETECVRDRSTFSYTPPSSCANMCINSLPPVSTISPQPSVPTTSQSSKEHITSTHVHMPCSSDNVGQQHGTTCHTPTLTSTRTHDHHHRTLTTPTHHNTPSPSPPTHTTTEPSTTPDQPTIFSILSLPLMIAIAIGAVSILGVLVLIVALTIFGIRRRRKLSLRRYVANPTYGRPELVSGEQRSSTDSKCSEPDVQVNMVMNEAYSVTPAGTADYFTLERPEDYHYQDPREEYHYYHNPTDGHLEENHYHLPTNGELEEHHYYHCPMHSYLENHYNCPTHAQRENHYESIS